MGDGCRFQPSIFQGCIPIFNTDPTSTQSGWTWKSSYSYVYVYHGVNVQGPRWSDCGLACVESTSTSPHHFISCFKFFVAPPKISSQGSPSKRNTARPLQIPSGIEFYPRYFLGGQETPKPSIWPDPNKPARCKVGLLVASCQLPSSWPKTSWEANLGTFKKVCHKPQKPKPRNLVGDFNPSEKILVKLDHFPK